MQDSIVQQVIKLAQEAGDVILEYYQKDITYQLKDDNTSLTQADICSHNIITDGLENISANIPILSEESALVPYDIRKKWQEYWLIDPLDGTQNFIEGFDEFCVSIAYIKNNRPIFGLLYAPTTKTHFYGIKGVGSFIYKNNTSKKITTKPKQKPLRIVTGHHSQDNQLLQKHLQGLGKYQLSKLGSALKFAYIANGDYDYYPRFGPCSEWDTAAGVCILEQAGGSVLDIYGNILYYNKSSSLISVEFISSC